MRESKKRRRRRRRRQLSLKHDCLTNFQNTVVLSCCFKERWVSGKVEEGRGEERLGAELQSESEKNGKNVACNIFLNKWLSCLTASSS